MHPGALAAGTLTQYSTISVEIMTREANSEIAV